MDNNNSSASSSSSSLQRSKSLIKSTSSLSLDENGLSTKIPTIVLTNTNDIESLNIISNDTTQSPSILYENDFDLYSMLKEMIKNPQQTKRNTKQTENINAGFEKKVAYKSYKKHLTAQLNDISYTDGKIKWSLLNNFTPLYSKTIKCIGTNKEDFELSEAIFLDLQPLSTRIKLMCKLIIIIQGACLERFGPPKMVQDRCVQFDGDIDLDTKNGTISRSESIKMSKIKSNSCENLLLDKSETNTTITTATTTFTVTNIDKNNNKLETRAVETLINQVERTEKNVVDDYDDDEETSNKDKRRKRQDSAPDVIEKALFKKKGTSSEANSEDEKDTKAKSKSQKKYDLENYYRHRVSKYSLKDYASLPYYQYSGKHVTKLDKGVNTDESYLLTHVKETIKSTTENTIVSQKESLTTTSTTKTTSAAPKVDSSTSTTDLINDFYMGYYSKSQLLSDQSLFNAKSTLWNSYSNTLPPSETANNEVKTEYFYSYSKEYYVKTGHGTSPPPQQQIQLQHPPQSHVSGFTIQTSPIPTNQMRPRPQKSSDWASYSQNSSGQRQQPSMPKTIASPTRRLVPNFSNQTTTSSQQNKPANNIPQPPRSTNQNQNNNTNNNNNNNNNKSHISVASINLVKPAKF